MTDNVAKRRHEIASVMYTDRDYILGIMNAFESSEINRSGSILETSEDILRSSARSDKRVEESFEFGPEIDSVFESLDRNFLAGRLPTVATLSGRVVQYDGVNPIVAIPDSGTRSSIETVSKKKVEVARVSVIHEDEVTSSESSTKRPHKAKVEAEIGTFMVPSRPYDPSSSRDAVVHEDFDDAQSFMPATRLQPWMNPSFNLRLLLVPLNAMFDMQALDMTISHRFGRNNTSNHSAFQGFSTLVVSRNHVDLFERGGKVYIKDIGSNSGTFRNNARLSLPGQVSPDVQLVTGDYIQLGKDFQDDTPLDMFGRIQCII